MENISQTRILARDAFFQTIEKFKGKPSSEKEFVATWINIAIKNGTVYSDGWYSPPPSGCTFLSATSQNIARVGFDSLRSPEYWPSSHVMIDWEDAIIFAYASFVDKQSGVIGDFSIYKYFGSNTEIIAHLMHCKNVNQKILDSIHPSMTSRELFSYSMNVFSEFQLEIYGKSTTDQADINLGHTIVSIGPPKKHNRNSLTEIEINSLSNSRRFLNNLDSWPLNINEGFTFEPRLLSKANKNLPLVSLHSLVKISKGTVIVQS